MVPKFIYITPPPAGDPIILPKPRPRPVYIPRYRYVPEYIPRDRRHSHRPRRPAGRWEWQDDSDGDDAGEHDGDDAGEHEADADERDDDANPHDYITRGRTRIKEPRGNEVPREDCVDNPLSQDTESGCLHRRVTHWIGRSSGSTGRRPPDVPDYDEDLDHPRPTVGRRTGWYGDMHGRCDVVGTVYVPVPEDEVHGQHTIYVPVGGASEYGGRRSRPCPASKPRARGGRWVWRPDLAAASEPELQRLTKD